MTDTKPSKCPACAAGLWTPNCTFGEPDATPATDDELARRLEWASGLNGKTLLLSLRAEGLDVIATRPEEADL